MFKRTIKQFIFIAALLNISACSFVNGKVGTYFDFETDLKLHIVTDKNINPDEKGESSPLFVRLYELKSDKLMDRADFISLYENDKEILGDDLIAKQELKRLIPGTQRKEHFVITKGVKYIALYAEFYDYNDANYAVVFPITENNVVRNYVKIRVVENRIELVEE